jgi:hypothetical protein
MIFLVGRFIIKLIINQIFIFINMKTDSYSPTKIFELEERLRKRRRVIIQIVAVLSLIIGWSVPLLIIIGMIHNSLWILFLGTGLIEVGFILQLLISSGEI